MFYKKIVLLISILFLSACASNSAPATEITINMTEFSYVPNSITIPVNQPVVLTIKNNGTQEHDFVIEKVEVTSVEMTGNSTGEHHMMGMESNYDLHISTAAGNTSTLSFIVTEPGTYKIFCSVAGHEIAGMSGELVVVSE